MIFLFIALATWVQPSSADCAPAQKSLIWPIAGQEGRDWTVNATLDQDPSTKTLKDEWGGTGNDAFTYDQHQGIDIDIPSFRVMEKGVAVHAVMGGIVVAVHDTEPDQQTLNPQRCNPLKTPWNFVRIRHADHSETLYGHLKKGSVPLRAGTKVVVNQEIGAVGSSGCSAQPHLHFELHNCKNQSVPSIQRGLWQIQPSRRLPMSVMDLFLTTGSFPSIRAMIHAPAHARSFYAGQTIGIGLSTAGGQKHDLLELQLLRPDGSLSSSQKWTLTSDLMHKYWYWQPKIGTLPGTWTLQVRINGKGHESYPLTVK